MTFLIRLHFQQYQASLSRQKIGPGTVTLYADEEGSVDKVLESQPEGNSVEIKEIVIIGYQNDGVIPVAYGSRDILSAEGRRVIESFPKLEIPELYGQTIKFKFKFLIR